MENQIKRPLSVWIAQTILICFVLVWTIPFLMLISNFYNRPSFLLRLLFSRPFLYPSFVVLLLFISFCGLIFRKGYARWLTVAILTICSGGFILSWVSGELDNSPPVAVIAAETLAILMVPLILRLSLGKAVTAFFNQDPVEIDIQAPPPPPLFES